jgi:hypothetical protein
MNGNKDYKLPALLANGTIGPYPKTAYDVALAYDDYYLTQATVCLAKIRRRRQKNNYFGNLHKNQR